MSIPCKFFFLPFSSSNSLATMSKAKLISGFNNHSVKRIILSQIKISIWHDHAKIIKVYTSSVIVSRRLSIILATSSRTSVYFGWSRVLQTSPIGLSKERRADVRRDCQCQKHVQRKSLHWWGNIDLSYRNSDVWEYRDNLIRNGPKKLVNRYYPLPVYFAKSLVSVSCDFRVKYRLLVR